MVQTPVLNEASFYVFAALALAGVLQLLWRPYLFATFPVLAACVWSAYILPQAYGILYNPWWLPEQIYDPGFAWTMVMASLCILAGYAGWAWGRGDSGPKQASVQIDYDRVFFAGTVFAILAFLTKYEIAEMTGGMLRYFSVEGSYELDWAGEEVILAVLSRYFQILAIPILTFAFVRKPRVIYLLPLALVLVFPVLEIILLNRRSQAVLVVLSIAIPLFFGRGWTPSRLAVLAGLFGFMVVVFVFPYIRGMMLIGATGGDPTDIAVVGTIVDQVLHAQEVKEFNNTIGIVASYAETGNYAYGFSTLDSWIRTTFPQRIMGIEIKSALLGNAPSFADVGREAFGWQPVFNHSVSAVARLFADFFLFGALAFFAIGFWFRRMYERALHDDEFQQMQYAVYAVLLPHWVAIGFPTMLREIVAITVLMTILKLLAVRRVPSGEPVPGSLGA